MSTRPKSAYQGKISVTSYFYLGNVTYVLCRFVLYFHVLYVLSTGYACSDRFSNVVTDINYVDRGTADPRRCSQESK